MNDIVPIDRTLSPSEAMEICKVSPHKMQSIFRRFGFKLGARWYISETVLHNLVYDNILNSESKFYDEYDPFPSDPWIDYAAYPPMETGEYLVCTCKGEVKLVKIRKGIRPRTKNAVVAWMEKPTPRKDTISTCTAPKKHNAQA